MKQRFLHVCYGTDQTIIDNAIYKWPGRLRACVQEKGGHFLFLVLGATIVTVFSHMTTEVSVFTAHEHTDARY